MRRYALAFVVALVAGCGGKGTTAVTPSSTPPSDNGGGGGAGNGGGSPGGGDGGGGMPGGGGGSGGMPGGGGGGGTGGGGTGGTGGGGGGGGGTACTDTQPVAIASAERGATSLAVDDTDVYFVAEQDPTMQGDLHVWRAPANGGAAVEVGSTDNWNYERMTINATAVFTLSRDGVLLRWPKGGGAPATLYDGRTDTATGCLADAHGFIFFCGGDTDVYALVRVPEDGGPHSVIAGFTTSGYLSNIAFDDRDVWMTAGTSYMVPDGGVYHMPYDADYHTQPVQAMSVYGTTLGPIAVDDSHVYVADSRQEILVADKRDGAPLTVLAHANGYPSVFRLDGGNLYVLAGIVDSIGNHGTITRYSLDGTRSDILADRAGLIGGMVVRGPYVYYTFENDSTVYRVCK